MMNSFRDGSQVLTSVGEIRLLQHEDRARGSITVRHNLSNFLHEVLHLPSVQFTVWRQSHRVVGIEE